MLCVAGYPRSAGENRQGGTGRTAFTLIELLVVIAIISLLVAILLPSLTKAKELAVAATCSAQLHSLGLAMAQYMLDYNDCYPLVYYRYQWEYSPKWFNLLYPYTGMYKVFNCPKLTLTSPNTDVQEMYDGVAGRAVYGFISNYRYNLRNFGLRNPGTGSSDRVPYTEETSRTVYNNAGQDFTRGIVIMCGTEWLCTAENNGSYQYLYHPSAYPHPLQEEDGASNVLFPDWHVELTPYSQVAYCWYPGGGYPFFVFYVEP